MTTKELVDNAGLKALSSFEPREITGVFISDMLSDVMTGAKSGNLWITVQTHKNIVSAANLVDVAAVIITGGKEVPRETIELANRHGIALFLSDAMTFDLVGKLYNLGIATR
jgi:predicted transcriptional regulator